MPAGRVFWMPTIRCLTRAATSRPFSPWSMMTMPATVSPLPSRVTAPLRGMGPTSTSATSPRRIGTPSTEARTMRRRSSTPATRPLPRTVKRSERCSTKPPLKDALFAETASTTWWSVRPYFSSRRGRTTTWYCCVRPPQELISETPLTERRRARTSQSWSVFFSIGSASPSTRYW